MTNESLPKQDLLIKLLALTASDSEGEALSAMRKANSLMATAGWTWERLIRGKIRVIADPFQSAPIPATRDSNGRMSAPQRPQPQAQWTPPRAQTPRPAQAPRPAADISFNPPRGSTMRRTGRVPKVEPRLEDL